ncbi:MAG TPA: RNA polymerase sigma factor [Beijerinckiaceae bacterium]|nr:RNA polymerase sigma factor [Beijerinckiaceae bacterium]
MSLKEDIEKLAPGLRRFARALVQHTPDDPHDVADELVHETIVRALRIERNWRVANAKIWLYATLANLNHGRLRTHISIGRGWRGQASAPDGGAVHASASGRSQGISHALDALPVEEREALLLVVLEGFNYNQAADVLGVPRSALAARVARARHFLTEHLDAALPIEARNRAKHPEYLRLVK